jgi:L-ribulose-5-phosphate 3-epimerase
MTHQPVNRRVFLQKSAVTIGGMGLAGMMTGATEPEPVLRKALQYGKLPDASSDAEKFRCAKEAGFQGIEAYPMEDLSAAAEMGRTARKAGIEIHSITYGGWKAPMSDPDPEVIARGHKEIENALRTAHAAGAGVVLLVPAVVNAQTGYREAWERSQKNIRPMLPLAEELGVVIAVENVWNKFLLSPLEFARYVDEFDSPWLRAYFDMGNVVIFGYPEDWIRTLGSRICRVHVKDFRRKGYQWCNLPCEGDVNQAEVRKALAETGYTGWLTEEFRGGDMDWVRDLSRRMDAFIEGREKLG